MAATSFDINLNGRFIIKELIGEGSLAEIYKIIDLNDNQM
jgi:hypothetical protein